MDVSALALAVTRFRDAGMSIALDDFGDGHSNLRLWIELRPRIVKIDRYFVKGLAASGDKFEIVGLLMRFAESFGTEVVAEGIEDLVDLMAARDLGVTLAQGFLLGRPERDPARRVSPEIQSATRTWRQPQRSPGTRPRRPGLRCTSLRRQRSRCAGQQPRFHRAMSSCPPLDGASRLTASSQVSRPDRHSSRDRHRAKNSIKPHSSALARARGGREVVVLDRAGIGVLAG